MGTAAKTERFELRLDSGILDDVDAWRGRQVDFPSRAEAVRRLIEAGLAEPKGSEIRFSDDGKLITLMLCDLFKHQKVKSEIDPNFVAAAIHRGGLWALGWEYSGIFHGHEDSKATLKEVVDILEMWAFLERGYARLSKKEKDRVAADAGPFGKSVVFPGFDGNYESEHLGIAGFLVNELGRFFDFKGRDLNSHCPLLENYRRMVKSFEPMRTNLVGQELDASRIMEILKAQWPAGAQKA
jgi:uncharacterized protein YfbU (UPF0304 family)